MPPFDIQIEIMKRLPIKSLIRFISVSKTWKSIIQSSEFIADYKASTHHLLLSFYNRKYVYIYDDDDDSFSQHKFRHIDLPVSVKLYADVIGFSQGLFGFCNYDESLRKSVVIWNPSIRKSVVIPVPNNIVLPWPYDTVFGFGVCNSTDHKIVKINHICNCEFDTISSSIPWQVEVFTLSSGKWRSLSNVSHPPRKSLYLTRKAVAVDRFIHWLVIDRACSINMILAFDMTSEEFTEIYLPPSLAPESSSKLDLSKLRESLVVIGNDSDAPKQEYGVWMMMEHGDQNSFIKLYTIKAPFASIRRVLGFRKNGEPIIEIQHGVYEHTLFVYEPNSKKINDIGIFENKYSSLAGSYMGTLLLLDQ